MLEFISILGAVLSIGILQQPACCQNQMEISPDIWPSGPEVVIRQKRGYSATRQCLTMTCYATKQNCLQVCTNVNKQCWHHNKAESCNTCTNGLKMDFYDTGVIAAVVVSAIIGGLIFSFGFILCFYRCRMKACWDELGSSPARPFKIRDGHSSGHHTTTHNPTIGSTNYVHPKTNYGNQMRNGHIQPDIWSVPCTPRRQL